MCGLKIKLGKHEPPVPPAAQELAQAILNDLEGMVEINKGKKAIGTLDEAEEVSGKPKRVARSGTMQEKDKVETRIRGKSRKQVTETRLLVEDDGSANDGEHAAQNGQGGKQVEELDDGDDVICLQAINAEEQQDRRLSKKKNTSPGKHEVTAGADVWNERFGQLKTFIRNRLLHICDIDIDEIHNDDDLEAWYQSLDHTHSDSSEILGYALILRSAAKLEEGISKPLQITLSRIGRAHERALVLVQRAEEAERMAQQSKLKKVQQDPQEGNNCEDEAQIDAGRMEVDMRDDIHTEQPDETACYLGMEFSFEMIVHETGITITQGFNTRQSVEASNDGGGDGDDGTSSPTDVALKHSRASSIASTVSGNRTIAKKIKGPSPIQNPLHSVTLEAFLAFSNDSGSGGIDTGLENHAMEGEMAP
ncbi:hypothetical protein L210DRAFT_3642705 [Boletus edulis BED1]|uniref:Uncharacterized protein n=1 Tax=Boletus edulis BED1 TaxID=1328754 RepID=A0AAD4C0C7_BOLED|nr:hypothetical protein L210DRAFT_3642705 [Boletus edulis BED1]